MVYLNTPTNINAQHPKILILDDTAPDLGMLKSVLTCHGTTITGAVVNSDGSVTVAGLPNLNTRKLDEVWESWLHYENVDVICLDVASLTKLQETDPGGVATLRRWVAAGGNLVLWGVRENEDAFGNLSDVDDVLGASPAVVAAREENRWDQRRGSRYTGMISPRWSKPDPLPEIASVEMGYTQWQLMEQGRGLVALMNGNQQVSYGRFSSARIPLPQYGSYNPYGNNRVTITADGSTPDEIADSLAAFRKAIRNADNDPPLLKRRCQFGQLVALPDSPFPGDLVGWVYLLHQIGDDRWNWVERHGVTLHNQNASFDDFPMPGVGLPPVNIFRFLITLFVLGIGPLNIFLLKRHNRLHLLVLSVPLAAAAVTLGLFGYAVVDDGLYTRSRSRSLTLLDAENGELARWSRMCFYSGLAPRSGLTFSDKTAVYPIDREDVHTRRGGRTRGTQWEDENQRLASGWLPSRTPTQLLAVRSDATKARLLVSQTPEGKLIAGNQLGSRIDRLVYRGSDGDYYVAEDVAPGEQVELLWKESRVPLSMIRAAMRESEFTTQTAVPPPMRQDYAWRLQGDEYGATVPIFNQNLFERTLEDLIESEEGLAVEPGAFVAVVDQPPDWEPGYARATVVDGFHVVAGRAVQR